MSKRRKNSFGTMFHGLFSDAKAAKKKARQVHGVSVAKNIKGQGRRFMVTSERKNPIRRRRNATSLRKVEALEKQKQELVQQRDWVQRDVSNLEAQGHTLNSFDRKFLKHRKKTLGKLERDLAKVEAKLVKAARTNPSELIVLGANPSPTNNYAGEEIVLPPNSTITIRTNPTRTNAGHGYGYDFHGAFTEKADAIAKEKATPGAFIKGRITPHGFRWIVMTKPAEPRGNVEFGEFDHGVFHPWTRRPKTRRKPATRRLKTRGNPSAAALREEFTGSPAEWETVSTEPHMPAGDYAQLGELLALYVKPGRGQQVQQINFTNRPLLVADESARQLYFVGGDQDISGSLAAFSAHDDGSGHFELGEARRIDYKQRKEHVPHPDVDEWRHDFGEESGVRPTLWFDANTKRLLLKGGEYEIRREGIVN